MFIVESTADDMTYDTINHSVQFDQMMKMIEVLGPPPQHLLTDAPKVSKYFDRLADGTFVPKRPECRQV